MKRTGRRILRNRVRQVKRLLGTLRKVCREECYLADILPSKPARSVRISLSNLGRQAGGDKRCQPVEKLPVAASLQKVQRLTYQEGRFDLDAIAKTAIEDVAEPRPLRAGHRTYPENIFLLREPEVVERTVDKNLSTLSHGDC